MVIVYDDERTARTTCATRSTPRPDRPVLVDRFLEDAIEVDVDCIADGETAVVGAIMEHIEQAGIHSGDTACVDPAILAQRDDQGARSSQPPKTSPTELEVRGLMNIQFAVKDEELYVIEVNPRASRTVPFVSKAIGVPLAKLAAKVMAGEKLDDLGFTEEVVPNPLLASRRPCSRSPRSPASTSSSARR